MRTKNSLQYRLFILALLVVIISASSLVYAQGTVDLAVQYVEGTPKADVVGYDVKVFLSVLDSADNPVKDLKADNFTVTEDSQKVNIDSVGPVAGEPINVVLLMDTSGSMGGVGIDSARKAAGAFVAGLDANDLVSVVTFDNTIKTVIDFTTDHKAVQDNIALINSTPNAGTCLYDAAYKAAQMTATVPAGRRAVVILTDGVDEKPGGGPCSAHSDDNLVDLATTGNTRVPIYMLGMGNKVDEATLKRIATDTGGRYLYSKDASQLSALFLRLADQLRSQYVLKYTSVAGPGAHGLAVSVDYLKARDTDTRNFLLPGLPTQIAFTSPEDGEQVSGKSQLQVSLSGQGERVESVAFLINGKAVGSDTTTPYQLDVDFSNYPAGDLTIEAIAYGAGNKQLAVKSISVKTIAGPVPTSTGKPPIIQKPNWAIIGGMIVVVLLAAALIVFLYLKRRRDEQEREKRWNEAQNPQGGFATPFEEKTIDGFEPNPDAMGTLVVETSDDPSMIGRHFDITGSLTRLGRSADNDVPFPKDTPVSRHHAEIAERNGGLFLSEVVSEDASGQSKRPTYGTCVNDRPLGPEPVMLHSGDVIQLGKRTQLRFQAGKSLSRSDDSTFDGLAPDNDPDKTREE